MSSVFFRNKKRFVAPSSRCIVPCSFRTVSARLFVLDFNLSSAVRVLRILILSRCGVGYHTRTKTVGVTFCEHRRQTADERSTRNNYFNLFAHSNDAFLAKSRTFIRSLRSWVKKMQPVLQCWVPSLWLSINFREKLGGVIVGEWRYLPLPLPWVV